MLLAELVLAQTARQPDHLKPVPADRRAARPGEHRLGGERQIVQTDPQMTLVERKVLCLDTRAGYVNDIETLAQAHEVLRCSTRTGLLAAIKIGKTGRTAHRHEIQRRAAKVDRVVRIRRLQVER
jgi:hypothetical protein